MGPLKGCERAALRGRAPPDEGAPSGSIDCTGVRRVVLGALRPRQDGKPPGGARAARGQSGTRKRLRAGPSRSDPRASIPTGPPRRGARIPTRPCCTGHAPRGTPPSGSRPEERTGGRAACSRLQPGAPCSGLRPDGACSRLPPSAVPPPYAVCRVYGSTSAAASHTQYTPGAGGRLAPRATHGQDRRALRWTALSIRRAERDGTVARRCVVPPLRAPPARRNPGGHRARPALRWRPGRPPRRGERHPAALRAGDKAAEIRFRTSAAPLHRPRRLAASPRCQRRCRTAQSCSLTRRSFERFASAVQDGPSRTCPASGRQRSCGPSGAGRT